MARATPQVGIPIVPGLPIPGLPVPSIPLPGVGHLPGLPSIPNPLSALSEGEKLIVKLLDPHTYVRMGEVTVGIILLAAGLFAALNGKQKVDSASRTIIRTGSVVAPGARAASSAGKVSYAREAGKINARKAAQSNPPLTKK